MSVSKRVGRQSFFRYNIIITDTYEIIVVALLNLSPAKRAKSVLPVQSEVKLLFVFFYSLASDNYFFIIYNQ